MDYQEIVTKYKKNSLETSNFRKRLEEAKPLKSRSRYRALRMSGRCWYYTASIIDLLTLPENEKKLDFFEKYSGDLLNEYFNELIGRIEKCNAWEFLGIKAKDFSKERFESVKLQEKFSIIYELNQRYCEFLEYQKLADLRGLFLDKNEELDNQTLKEMSFFREMFSSLKSDNVKREFFCFDEHFVHALLRYKTSKDIRLEDHMRNQRKGVFKEYKKFEQFFSTEDYRDIIENILLASNTTKMSRTEIIRIYSQMAETEAEQQYIISERQAFKDLEEKCYRMGEVRLSHEKQRIVKENCERDESLNAQEKRKEEEVKREIEESKRKILEAKLKAERDRIIAHEEGYTEELDRKISGLQRNPTVKEAVIPVLLIWMDKDDVTIARKIGSKRLTAFFDKLKGIQKKEGNRVSLFLITNADQETTKRRIEELRKKAQEAQMPRIVEGALGGYSSFMVDETGEIKEVSKMSTKNREKIKLLLENAIYACLPRDIIDETEQNYLRYIFSDKPDKSITKQYLGMMVGQMLNDERVRRQPLKFMPFIEKKATGIDVVLDSQIKGISKIHEYYEAKYDITSGKSYKVNIETIDQFQTEKATEEVDAR